MHGLKIIHVLLAGLLICCSSPAQQSSSLTQSAASLIGQSLAVQTGGQALNGISMTGAVSVIQGSTTMTGTIALNATGNLHGQVEIEMSSGHNIETRDFSGTSPVGTKTLSNEGSEQMSVREAAAMPPAWFLPALVLSSNDTQSTYIGREQRQGAPVEHLALWKGVYGRFLTQSELYLDPTTLLPTSVVYHVPAHRPDGTVPVGPRAPQAISLRLVFSDYRHVMGLTLPFHIEEYLGADLVRDIVINKIAAN